ncbi:hemophore-related protein [Nocardia sp. NPDC058480]|uniref:hemophore-related protein n=1 Tax=unclassified Nocardia TaxID=2637762 RepID=UPI003652B2CC
MKTNLPERTTVRTALVTGLATLATVGTIGMAAAAPADRSHPMLDTTCSLEQIEAAALAHAPELAAKMAQHPEHRAKLAELLSKTPEERRIVIQQRQGAHAGQHTGEHTGQHAAMREVFEVCGDY